MKNSYLLLLIVLFSCTGKKINCIQGDCVNGSGTFVYNDGITYEGDFKNGQRNGKGKIYSSKGTCYAGEWKNHQPHGNGRKQWGEDCGKKSGESYEGRWENWKMNGFGTYYYADGRSEIGFWHNNVLKPDDSIPHDFVKSKWELVNEEFFLTYETRITFSDIQTALNVLKKENLIDSTIKISTNNYPSFCYLSPSAMLDQITEGNTSTRPEALKLLTIQDKNFILEQHRQLRKTGEFNWQLVTNQVDSTNSYPHYSISLPVFTKNKEAFIVSIEMYTKKNCMKGISWFVQSDQKGKTRYYKFDEANACD